MRLGGQGTWDNLPRGIEASQKFGWRDAVNLFEIENVRLPSKMQKKYITKLHGHASTDQ